MSKPPSISFVMGDSLRGEAAPALVLRIGINYGFGEWMKVNGELPIQELDGNKSVLRCHKIDPKRGDSFSVITKAADSWDRMIFMVR